VFHVEQWSDGAGFLSLIRPVFRCHHLGSDPEAGLRAVSGDLRGFQGSNVAPIPSRTAWSLARTRDLAKTGNRLWVATGAAAQLLPDCCITARPPHVRSGVAGVAPRDTGAGQHARIRRRPRRHQTNRGPISCETVWVRLTWCSTWNNGPVAPVFAVKSACLPRYTPWKGPGGGFKGRFRRFQGVLRV